VASDQTAESRVKAAVDRETGALAAALNARDDQAFAFLKFHLLAEQMLQRLILIRLPNASRLLKEGRLTFHQKALLVDACGLVPASAIAALLEVNSVRNKLAHQRGARITAGELESIAAHVDWPAAVGRPPISEQVLGVSMTLVLPEVYRPFVTAAIEAELHAGQENHEGA
jgi:hypothetical protein